MKGLVLQGGGARGAFQAGAWRAFRELGIEFDVITGTSIGALNGAMMVQGDYEKCHELWYNITPNTLMLDDPKAYSDFITAKLDIKDSKRYFDYIKKAVIRGGLDIDPLVKLIDETADEERIRNSKIRLGLVAISLTDREVRQIYVDEMAEGTLKDYLLASSFLPFFKPIYLHGKRFLDGGAYDNFPIDLMLKNDVDEIVTIELSSFNLKPLFKNSRGIKLKRIIPSEELGNRFDFSTQKARHELELGYLDTLKFYGAIDGFDYFLTDVIKESVVQKAINDIKPQRIRKLAKFMGEKVTKSKRVLYERIIPDIARLVGASAEEGYSDIYIRAIEVLAKNSGLERVKKYDFNELVEMVMENSDERKGRFEEFKNVPEIIKRRAIFKSAYNDYLIYEFVKMLNEYIEK